MTLIACRDCAAIQRLKPLKRGRLECVRCGRVLENRTGRSLDGALACAIAVLLLLIPANTMTLMSVNLGPVTSSTVLASGLSVAWAQRWPLVSIVLALEAIILPFLRFSLLSVALAAIRLGRHDKWLGRAFRYSELLDPWAMTDVLLIGGGIGYGRLAAETSVSIGVGGWCFVCVALLTMITRGTLERREVWRRLGSQPISVPPWAVACTGCDLLLPAKAVGRRCPRCAARIYRRRPGSLTMCAALLIATTVLTPIAYGYPMSEFWMGNHREPHSVVNGIILLFTSGFWYFGIIIFFVSLVFPLSKLVALTWFLTSIHGRSRWQLRLKMKVYRFIDEVGRWSTLDPFTVLVFAPMIQFGQLAHFDFMGGAAAFLATVVLSMFATLSLDPRLMWDAAAKERAPAPAAALKASA
ncbi:MAG TPA: paraquat-inducible protein A [Acetobacteraceae bacterium]